MHTEAPFDDRLAVYLYNLVDITHIYSAQFSYQNTFLYTLLLVNDGKGTISIDGRNYPLHRHKAFIIAPHTSVNVYSHSQCPLDYYQIQFHALQTKDQSQFAPAELNCPNELHSTHFHYLSDKMHEIEMKHKSRNKWDSMKANILFQEMIFLLFKESVPSQQSGANQSITLTLDYIEQNYPLHITRKKLAEMAGMSTDYYSRAFKKKVGKSPMEYLSDIRINQAKQLLMMSHDTLRSIAHQVGFSDEFYFSRKFKAVTGNSPTAYVSKIKN